MRAAHALTRAAHAYSLALHMHLHLHLIMHIHMHMHMAMLMLTPMPRSTGGPVVFTALPHHTLTVATLHWMAEPRARLYILRI